MRKKWREKNYRVSVNRQRIYLNVIIAKRFLIDLLTGLMIFYCDVVYQFSEKIYTNENPIYSYSQQGKWFPGPSTRTEDFIMIIVGFKKLSKNESFIDARK